MRGVGWGSSRLLTPPVFLLPCFLLLPFSILFLPSPGAKEISSVIVCFFPFPAHSPTSLLHLLLLSRKAGGRGGRAVERFEISGCSSRKKVNAAREEGGGCGRLELDFI